MQTWGNGCRTQPGLTLTQKDRQKILLAVEIIRGLNTPAFCTSTQATRVLPLPKLDCGFVQPHWCLISSSQGRKRRDSRLGQPEQHKMEHVTAPSSPQPALLRCTTGKQHHWAEHRQSSITPMPALTLPTQHPDRRRCSVMQMSLQCPLEGACKWDPAESPSTQGAYAVFSWWCKSEKPVRQVHAAKLLESYGIFLLAV